MTRILTKVLKEQQKKIRKRLFQKNVKFELIAPEYYEKMLEVLIAEKEDIKQFVSDYLTTGERVLLFEKLSNEALEKLLMMEPTLFKYVSDKKVKETIVTASYTCFEKLFQRLSLSDKIRFITIILSTPELSRFRKGIFSDEYLYVDMQILIKFMKELSEDPSYARAEEKIYFLIATSLQPAVLARFIEVDLEESVTEKIITELAEIDALFPVIQEICTQHRVKVFSKFDCLVLRKFAELGYDVVLNFDNTELLELYQELKAQGLLNLLPTKTIIKCYCEAGLTEKKYILKYILSEQEYEAIDFYQEICGALDKPQKLEMIELMLEMYVSQKIKCCSNIY